MFYSGPFFYAPMPTAPPQPAGGQEGEPVPYPAPPHGGYYHFIAPYPPQYQPYMMPHAPHAGPPPPSHGGHPHPHPHARPDMQVPVAVPPHAAHYAPYAPQAYMTPRGHAGEGGPPPGMVDGRRDGRMEAHGRMGEHDSTVQAK